MIYGILRREYHPGSLTFIPDTTPFNSEPRGTGKGNPMRVYAAVITKLHELNTDNAVRHIITPGAHWVNIKSPPLRCESIGFGGNFVKIIKKSGQHYRVATFQYTASSFAGNWFSSPTLYWATSAVDKNLKVIKCGNGLDETIPHIANGGMWFHESYVEVLPAIPEGGLPVTLPTGRVIKVEQYRLVGASVIGKYFDDGLLKSTYLRRYKRDSACVEPTSWHLHTTGVIPPL